MKNAISFYPDVDKKTLDSGLISEISWQRLATHLDAVFNIQEDERIAGITYSGYGIKAKIEKIK